MVQYYTQSVEEVLQKFEVNPDTGLSEPEIEKRKEKYGLNKLATKKQKSLLSIFLEQFKSSMVVILLIAAVISGVIGVMEGEGLVEAFVILAILLLNAIIGTVEERKAQTSLEALNKMSSPRTKVLREGQIDSIEIVPGDIVVLDTGDIIPADMRLLEAVNLKVQESALTGESVPEDKISSPLDVGEIPLGDRTNMAFSTSIVTYGRGRGVIVGTGMNTEVGKIANEVVKMAEKDSGQKDVDVNHLPVLSQQIYQAIAYFTVVGDEVPEEFKHPEQIYRFEVLLDVMDDYEEWDTTFRNKRRI